MILVDTSVWIDYLRGSAGTLASILESAEVASHPFVIGELACGNLARREAVLGLLAALPAVPVATYEEVMMMVASRRVHDRGIGWIDAHLLASALVDPGCRLWTRDRRLSAVATELGVQYTDVEVKS